MNTQRHPVTASLKPSFTPARTGVLQRKCACGNHTVAGGECAECRNKKPWRLQARLMVNEPGDVHEQEADRIAEQAMAVPAHSTVASAPRRIQRFSGQSNRHADMAPASVDQALASPGRPLEPALRQDMEQRFGYDFSRIRVHTDAAAQRSARDVDANAYTVGHDLVFGAGRFAPGTSQGRRLLAHELTHVLQQSRAETAGPEQGNRQPGLSATPTHPRLQRDSQACMSCTLGDPNKLSPRDWLHCTYQGCINANDANPLRFANTGVIATRDEIRKWVVREGITEQTEQNAIGRVVNSYDFLGSTKAREDAKVHLINAIARETLSVCIRPVQIADDNGKNPTALPSFAAVQNIWRKCCIDVSVAAAKTVPKTAFKTLHHDPDALRATAEEASLYRASGGGGGCIAVFIAQTFQRGSETSKDIGGGAATFGTPDGGSAVFAVEGVDPTIVAHELGHAMGLGPMEHRPAGTVMEVTASKHDQKESDQVAKVTCDTVRTFANAKSGGKKDCDLDIIK